MFSPLEVSVCQLTPASPANWQSLSFQENVDFNVIVLAFTIPRVLTTFHESTSSASGHSLFLLLSFALKQH